MSKVPGWLSRLLEEPGAYDPFVAIGLLPPLDGPAPKGRRGRVGRRKLMTERAKRDIQAWLDGQARDTDDAADR